MTAAIDIHDIKGPVLYGWDLSFYQIIFLSLIFLIGVVGFYYLRRVLTKDRSPHFRPAHQVASEALIQLKEKGFPEEGQIGEYYLELTRVIRTYLQDRFGYKAMDMTSEQLLSLIGESGKLSQDQQSLATQFFAHCDLVKFSGYRPSTTEMEWGLKTGQTIIKENTGQ